MADLARATILVYYDSHAIRETVRVLDETPTGRIVECDDETAVEEVVRRESPGLAIVCAMAPTSAAFEHCRRIKRAAAGRVLPVILYALRWDAEVVRRAYEAGADDCVPVRPTDDMLSWRVRSLLRLARACGPDAPGGE